MDKDNVLIPLSYISQYGYCPRRAALLMNEQVWSENEYTASGRAQHERVHTMRMEKRGLLVKLYEHKVFSEKLGLSGKCDCIEAKEDPQGCFLSFLGKNYWLYPIEYKHGAVRQERAYQLQLCAQAMCLEEMYNTHIPVGALFFANAHRRDEIILTKELRKEVLETAQLLRELADEYIIPRAKYGPRCKKCSLADYCAPKVKSSSTTYCDALLLEFNKGVEDYA